MQANFSSKSDLKGDYNRFLLIYKFLDFINYNKIDNFIKTFFDINLNSKIELNNDNKFLLFRKVINVLIEKFNKENNNDCLDETRNRIFEYFYGRKKNIDQKITQFNTIYINLDNYGNNKNDLSLYNIMIEQNITLFPKVLIIIFDKYVNNVKIPLEFPLNMSNSKYILKGSVQYNENKNNENIKEKEIFNSIVIQNKRKEAKKINTFVKIFHENNKYHIKEISDNKEFNKCFIFFYEREDSKRPKTTGKNKNGNLKIKIKNVDSQKPSYVSNQNYNSKKTYIQKPFSFIKNNYNLLNNKDNNISDNYLSYDPRNNNDEKDIIPNYQKNIINNYNNNSNYNYNNGY